MKDGKKSTEFWLTIAATLIAALLSSGVLPEGSLWVKIAGAAAAVLGALGYTASRTLVKVADAKAKAFEAASKVDP